MGNHRAPRRANRATPGPSVAGITPAESPSETSPARSSGKRRAVRHAGRRGQLVRRLPSVPVLLGVAALAVSAAGAVTVSSTSPVADANFVLTAQANAMSGETVAASTSAEDQRKAAVSRDSRRDALQSASSAKLQAAVEAQAKQRNAELAKLAQSAEKQAARIALNLWQLPLESYRLSATFGQSSGLWANTHTGLDFAADYGSPVASVTNGTVTSVGYEGSYGNKVTVTTDDGEELWYAHLSGFAVSVGEEVRSGEVLGYVGSTGNSTGNHLHLEVRPGAGDPVDPFSALVAHGVTP
ncbi:M23 family metallopeptidase [Nocardioides donggukensis]|uniref:Peptidoglycan DD-metalloendopeptidase family protein n=1 Tax=Nocardioides donggukensis TaxID=2774019 RepID=A0A927K4B9_9ACTN|nr:M23 family metallopeptidase [Nocardioides donggukensis]MBD8868628.1 peptidoglycan DD-metalloendopeptidase family protein [Nocardioides donggukensis]